MTVATVGLPRGIFRSVEAATEVDKRRGLVRAIISDESRDRFNTVFMVDGCDSSAFMKAGGPVLHDHGKGPRGTVPVGNVEALERTTFKGVRSIAAETRFWDSDDFSRMIGEAYLTKKMRGWSINCLPVQVSSPTAEERRTRPDMADVGAVYRRWALLEVSVCSLAGNENCLTTEVMRSMAGSRPMSSTKRKRWDFYDWRGEFRVYDVVTLRTVMIVPTREMAWGLCEGVNNA